MDYSKRLIEEFQNPSNVGELDHPDGFASLTSDVCGDAMNLYLRIEDGRIQEARFKTFGCAAAIASSSMLTKMITGMTIEDARAITKEDVVRALDGMPEPKVHCSLLAVDALQEALGEYLRKSGP